jgi:RNA polymerase sigma-70 factor (ECF subfamily)
LANQRRRLVREELARARLDARALLSPDDVEALVTQMDASAEATRVRAAMEGLAEPYREVLLLVGESSLSPISAAKAVGISHTAFRVRLSRARRALRRALETQVTTSSAGEGGTTMKEALL